MNISFQLQNAVMFLCTLSVVVCIAVANSNAQLGQLDAKETTRYNVPQEIRDSVPVDFAAANLRKSRLNYQSAANIVQYRDEDVNNEKKLKGLLSQRINLTKRPNEMPDEEEDNRRKNHHRESSLGSRKRSSQNTAVGHKKSPGFRMNNFRQAGPSTEKQTSALRRETVQGSKNNKQSYSRSRSPSTMRPNKVLRQKSENSFDNIKKAINALPQQMVKVVRDDIDCADDPRMETHDIRGSPCTFSPRWTASGGNPWLWLNNVIPQNWELFYN